MKITFIGGGNMASALIGGLLRQGFAASDIRVVEPLAESRARLAETLGVECRSAPDAAALACDALVLAVKPQQMKEAALSLAGRLEHQLVLSIAAGLRLEALSRWLGKHRRLARAMPNTPALIGAGISALYADANVDAAGRALAEKILGAAGRTLWLDDEAQMDAVTAVSGSGPAYVFYFIEALREAARQAGLGDEAAGTLAIETFLGASRLAAQSPDDVAVLRQRVTSRGGTTEAALQSFEADGIRAAMARGVAAALRRSRELGDQLGEN